MVWVADAETTWLWVMVLMCFFSAAGGFVIYLFINNVRSVPRSFVDYVLAIAVFIVSTLVAFSIVLGLDAIGEKRPDSGAGTTARVVETVGDDESETADLTNSAEAPDEAVNLGANGQ